MILGVFAPICRKRARKIGRLNMAKYCIKKWLGEVVGKEGEDFRRYDKWLCMMYPL